MSTRRESWYHCTFQSEEHQVTAAVQAWSEQAAVDQFATVVQEVTHDPGTVRVELGLEGVVTRVARRNPSVHARTLRVDGDASASAH